MPDITSNNLVREIERKRDAVGAAVAPAVAPLMMPLLEPQLNDMYAPKWKPSTAYAVGDVVVAPDGTIVRRTTAGTSGATYSGANWTVLTLGSERDGSDTKQTVTRRTWFEDTATSPGALVDIKHSSAVLNSYGIDIHNEPGAKSGLVIHQYSNAQAAIQLDNTDTQPMILVKNTNNPTRNPGGAAAGTSATGDAFRLVDTAGTNMFQVLSRGEVLVKPAADAAGHGLEIVGNAGSTRRLIKTTMNSVATGIEFVATAGAAGAYPMLVTGYDYGPHFTTSQDGASRTVLQITKNGTGAGIGIKVTNKGTGRSITVASASADLAGINADGEFEHLTAGKGLLLRSPDGTRYRVSVANGGTVSVVAAP